ncbi:MAG TPA: MFS transporter [Bacillota bacterium]
MGLVSLVVAGVRPLLPVLAHNLGVSPALIGVMVASFAVVPLVLAIPMGFWVARTGTGRLATLGGVGIALGVLSVVVWPTYPGLLVCQLLLGICHLAVAVDTQTTVSGVDGREDRARALGLYTTFISGGQLVGPLLAGVSADAFGFRTTIGMAAFVAVPLLLAARRLLPETNGRRVARDVAARPSAAHAPTPVGGDQVFSLFKNPSVVLSMASGFAVIFTLGVRQAFLPLYVEMLGYSSTALGGLLSARALASMFSRILMDRLTTIAGGRFRLLVAALLVTGLALGTIPLMSTMAGLLLVSVLVGAAAGLVQPLSMVALAEGTDRDLHGLAVSVRLTGNRLAQLISPLVFGVVAEARGIGAAFYAAGGVLLLVTAGLLPFGRLYPKGRPVERGV